MTKEEKAVLLSEAMEHVAPAIEASVAAHGADHSMHWYDEAEAAIRAYEEWRRQKGITDFVAI